MTIPRRLVTLLLTVTRNSSLIVSNSGLSTPKKRRRDLNLAEFSSIRRDPSMTTTDDDTLVIRQLERGDFSKSYLDLLAQLTTVDRTMSDAALQRHFDEMFPDKPRAGLLSCLAPKSNSSSPYCIFVIEDTSKHEIVATATLFVEKKFIRGCASCGHIEDVVVDGGYRGKQLGKRVIERCIEEAKLRGCYKVILDCSEDNAAFYAKCGLERKEIQMVSYL